MTTMELYNKINSGLRPIVRFTECIADSDSQYEANMMGTIISAVKNHNGIVDFLISEKGYEKYNIQQEKPVWYKDTHSDVTVCKSKLGGRKTTDLVCEDYDMDICNFNVVVEDTRFVLFEKYMNDNTDVDYINWLENKLMKLLEGENNEYSQIG